MDRSKRAVKDSVLWKNPLDDIPERLEAEGIDPEDAVVEVDEATEEEFYRWHRAIAEEPTMAALNALASRAGTWVGDEARLYEAVEGLTAPGVRRTGPFPSDPDELMRHVEDIEGHSWVFPGTGLEVLDRRELSNEEIENYDAPGWDPGRPILVAKGGAASKSPLFYEALFGLARYQKPLLVAILKSTRTQPHWSGTTLQMKRRLWAYYPDNRPEGYGWIFRAEEWADDFEGCSINKNLLKDAAYETPYSGLEDPYRLLDYSLEEWIGSKDDFSEHPKDLDLLELYKLVALYSSILERFGVKVTHEKPSSTERTKWTIEALAWDFDDPDRVFGRLWHERHADWSARGSSW